MTPLPDSTSKQPFIKFPPIPPVVHDPALNTYYCPYCNNTIAQGYISRIQMVCGFCYRFINADAGSLVMHLSH